MLHVHVYYKTYIYIWYIIFGKCVKNGIIFFSGLSWSQAVKVRILVFDANFNNISAISWWSVLLVDETRVSQFGFKSTSLLIPLQWGVQPLSSSVIWLHFYICGGTMYHLYLSLWRFFFCHVSFSPSILLLYVTVTHAHVFTGSLHYLFWYILTYNYSIWQL